MQTTPALFRRLAASALAMLVTSLAAPAIASAGTSIYVSSQDTDFGTGAFGSFGSFDLATGASKYAGQIPTYDPEGIAVSGGNVYVAGFGHAAAGAGTVAEYNAATGAAVNPAFISGLTGTNGLLIAGNTLYVSSFGLSSGTVGSYNATTGAAINSSVITGLNRPYGMALAGNNLFVAEFGNNRVGEYNATTGAAVNPSFISMDVPTDVAISGNTLYVCNPASFVSSNSTIATYNATTGAPINLSLITAAQGIYQIAIVDGKLLAVDYTLGTVAEYDAATGSLINPNFESGLTHPIGIAADAVPEPASIGMIGLGAIGLVGRRRRTRHA